MKINEENFDKLCIVADNGELWLITQWHGDGFFKIEQSTINGVGGKVIDSINEADLMVLFRGSRIVQFEGSEEKGNQFINRIGERGRNSEGFLMEVTGYRNANDVDIKFVGCDFEIKGTRYSGFKDGTLSNPIYKVVRWTLSLLIEMRLNEKKVWENIKELKAYRGEIVADYSKSDEYAVDIDKMARLTRLLEEFNSGEAGSDWCKIYLTDLCEPDLLGIIRNIETYLKKDYGYFHLGSEAVVGKELEDIIEQTKLSLRRKARNIKNVKVYD